MTSKSSSHNARIVRSAADGSGATGATEPLDDVGMLIPTGVDEHGGRRSVARRQHPRLVAAPRSDRARARTWPWTPPGRLRLYGQMMPIRSGVAASARRARVTARSSRLVTTVPFALGRRDRAAEGLVVARPVRLIRCHCSGARRISSSSSWARSWVTRVTSSRSRPCRSVSRGGLTYAVAPVALEVDRGRQERRPGSQGQKGGPARQRGPLAEELDLDAGAREVTVAQEAHDLPRQDRRAAIRSRLAARA